MTDWFGKRYHIPTGQAYKAVNAKIQGACASIFKQALVNINAHLDEYLPEAHILLPVHDEFQLECPNNTGLPVDAIKYCMIHIHEVLDRGLTLKVDVAKSVTNWAEKVKVA